MRKLSTIQKRENLNEVYAVDNPGNGGTHHEYGIYKDVLVDSVALDHEKINLLNIQFQNGARKEEDLSMEF